MEKIPAAQFNRTIDVDSQLFSVVINKYDIEAEKVLFFICRKIDFCGIFTPKSIINFSFERIPVFFYNIA